MTLQCIVTSDHHIRFIEINPRFGGGAPLGIAAGADYPGWLMQELLGCANPAEDYAVGNNLFEQREWEWMVAGSYYNYALLESDQITVTFPNGLYEVRDWDYRLSESPQFRGDVLEAVSEQNARYFR